MPKILALVSLAVLWGGARDACALEVALIGDNSRQAAFEQLAREFRAPVVQSKGARRAGTVDRKVTFTVAGSDPVAVANQVLTADLALLVVDASQGPLPIVREHILVARQSNVPLLAIFFARTRELRTAIPTDPGEFLNLEEMVVREMLDTYKMGADSSPVFFDSAIGDVYESKSGDGTPALRRFLASGLSSRVPSSNLKPVSEFGGTFYLLMEQEGREPNRAISVANDTKLDVWIAGSMRQAVVRTKGKHAPGDAPDFTLQLKSPANAAPGLRLMLLRDGMVVGVGVVAKVIR